VKLEEDEGRKKGTSIRIPEAIIKKKKDIYTELDKAFKLTNKTLRSLFSKVDVDQSNEIELDEFSAMFQKMNIKLTPAEVE